MWERRTAEDPAMAAYYRVTAILAAIVSLGLAGCSASPASDPDSGLNTQTLLGGPASQGSDPDEGTSTIWTLLGIADSPKQLAQGPQTGAGVSPVLWEAAHDALHFAHFASEDPQTGSMVTDWYSPPGKPDERLRVVVLITSRALRSDSIAVSVERQTRSADGQWVPTTIDREVADNLDTAILQRARQIHRAHPPQG
jgi:Domain of unknown function (DUF3576)